MSVHVCTATPADADFILHANLSMAAETEDKGLDSDKLSAGIHYLLEHPNEGIYLIAEIDGQSVGTSMLTFEWSEWRNGRFWWIQSVYVLPEARRQGVYSALHETSKKLAKEVPQACGIRLYVEQDNVNAQKTYQALGMFETHYRLYEEGF